MSKANRTALSDPLVRYRRLYSSMRSYHAAYRSCLIGGGVGGIISSVAFMASESPHYTVSMLSRLLLVS